MAGGEGVRVGLGLVVVNDAGQILLTRRLHGDNGPGEFAVPGGAYEPGESMAAGVLRELAEECGDQFKVRAPVPLCVLTYVTTTGEQWLGVNYLAQWESGEPRVMEPDKHEGWAWHDIATPPQPLYLPTQYAIEAMRTGRVWFDEAIKP